MRGSNDPYATPLVCPHDGTSSEDMREHENGWLCPTCERILQDDELVDVKEWAREMRDEQRMSDAGL